MAKKTTTLRVHQVAKELGVSSKDIVEKCLAEQIPGVANHQSAVSMGLYATIKEWFGAGGDESTAVETAAPVDVSEARRHRRRVRVGGADEGGEGEGGGTTTITEPEPEPELTVETTPSAPPPIARPAAVPPAPPPSAPAPPATPAAAPKPAPAPQTERPTIAAAAPSAPAAPAPAAPVAPATPRERPAAAASAPAAAPPPPSAPSAPPRIDPSAPRPVMNVPTRPKVVSPAGEMLTKPKAVAIAGPKVIRIEKPEPMPERRDPSRGRGPGMMDPRGAPIPGRGGAVGRPTRTPRRGAETPRSGSGRTGRTGSGFSDQRGFNWREADMRERDQRLSQGGGFFKKQRRDNPRTKAKAHRDQQSRIGTTERGGAVQVAEPITPKSLSLATGVRIPEIIGALVRKGRPLVGPDGVMDSDAALEIMLDRGIELEIQAHQTAGEQIVEKFRERTRIDQRTRAPIVTILGHVDHGKTSLLDRIRNANVAAGEAGGITQATSAFRVGVKVGDEERTVTFIDTPGHEAFTEMRSRGAKVTDIAVLVVAADDGVMPQTIESISHAKAAGVPIVVALNKIDKAEATQSNITRILGQLAEHGLNPVEWGGDTEVVRVSATKGTGVEQLLEVLDLQAQILELAADFAGAAEGSVIEAQVEEGRGPVARLIVQEGLLKKGDFIVAGRGFGRVRDIVDDRGRRVPDAGPGTPVAISGLSVVPDAGDRFYCVGSLKEAEAAAAERQRMDREKSLATEKVTLDNIFDRMKASGRKELPLVVKADVQGSLETLRTVLGRIGTDEVRVVIKHAAIGGVNESDVRLAETTGAIIVGFNVTAAGSTRKLAEASGVDIRFYDVIYDITDDVTKAAEGLLDPELKLEVLGHAEVRAVFKISKVGMIAGCYVTDGTIRRNAQIRVTRGGIVVEKDRRLEQLKRFKDDAKEVGAGQECGMKIDGYDDIREGDVLECYLTQEVRRTL